MSSGLNSLRCVTSEPRVVLTARARLGEGPVWDQDSGCLYWVDIYNHRVHQFNPETGSDRYIDVGETVGAIALVHPSPFSDATHATQASGSETLILALRHGLAYLDVTTETLTPITTVEPDQPLNRFNDGKCDAAGRFWFGSMSNQDEGGSLYKYQIANDQHSNDQEEQFLQGDVTLMERGLTISNGLGWSPDNRTFYLTDSPLQKIFAYEFDLATGTLSNRRLLIDLTQESYFPDGLTVDADGCLWVAMWDGWCVTRFDPTGQEIGRLKLPVQRPTSCTFGGADLSQLYITTASVGLSESEIQASFLSGDLFCVETTVKGLPSYAFSAPL